MIAFWFPMSPVIYNARPVIESDGKSKVIVMIHYCEGDLPWKLTCKSHGCILFAILYFLNYALFSTIAHFKKGTIFKKLALQ